MKVATVMPYLYEAPFLVAIQNNYFEKEGLDVEFTSLEGGNKVL